MCVCVLTLRCVCVCAHDGVYPYGVCVSSQCGVCVFVLTLGWVCPYGVCVCPHSAVCVSFRCGSSRIVCVLMLRCVCVYVCMGVCPYGVCACVSLRCVCACVSLWCVCVCVCVCVRCASRSLPHSQLHLPRTLPALSEGQSLVSPVLQLGPRGTRFTG